MDQLRNKFFSGTWHYIKDAPRQYGGRTLRQLEEYSITIDMNRYLRERAHEIKIESPEAGGEVHAPRDHCWTRAHGFAELGDQRRYAPGCR